MTDFQFPPGRLRTLDDVTFGTPTNGQVMAYDSATGKVKFVDPGSIADGAITNAKLATVATATIKGRATSGTGAPEDLSASQVRTLLDLANLFISTTSASTIANGLRLNVFGGGDTQRFLFSADEDSPYFKLNNGVHELSLHIDTASGFLRRNGYKVWDETNDGAGSGLDADTINGYTIATIFNSSSQSAGTLPAARLADNISWDPWAMDLVPTTNVGYAVYRHPSKPIRGPCAKSGSSTLQTGVMCFAPRRAPYGLAAYKTTGAFKFAYTADDNDSANVRITSCALYGSNDLDNWVTVYSDSTARTPASANAITTVSINAAGLATATVYAYYAVEFGVSVRSGKCLYIGNVEVNGQ